MNEQPSQEMIQQMHRWFAVECNNHCWDLLEKPNRSSTEDRDLLYLAYAAAYHWSIVGTALNGARAEVLLSEAHSQLGYADLALTYAKQAIEFFENNDCEDWDLAYGHAALAYAAAVAGDAELHAAEYATAKRRGETIADEIDRNIFLGSFAQVPTEVIQRNS